MRKVVELKFEVIKQSDLDQKAIYAFCDGKEVSLLVRKNDQYWWKPIKATDQVWYKMYDTIEEAIEGILNTEEYKGKGSPDICEFWTEKEFYEWALKKIEDESN